MEVFLWQARTSKGMNLIELAKRTGISKTRLNDIENGRKSPKIEELEWVCEVLDVYLEDLFSSEKSRYYNKYVNSLK